MKKSPGLVFLLFSLLAAGSYAQGKKVAVVTFYVVKQIGLNDFGPSDITASISKLGADPNFNMGPLLRKFHNAFFDGYARSFPFELLPEEQVTGNEAYKAFAPESGASGDLLKDNTDLPARGYKVVLPLPGHGNEKELVQIFDQCDGIMKVYLNFDLEKRGFGGLGLIKVNAYANITLFNRKGDKVFSIKEEAMSRSSGALIAGMPSFSAEKILPLCESAVDELMKALQNDLPKMARKADRKL